MKSRLAYVILEREITKHYIAYSRRFNPISLPDLNASEVDNNKLLGRMFNALANVEDDSVYMRARIHAARADRLHVIDQFNELWLAEEAAHARALEYTSRLYGFDAPAISHSVMHRGKRAIAGTIGLRIASLYHPGILGSYLTLGAMQEHTALTTYNAIAEMQVPPAVKTLLRRISSQEGRHLRFYSLSAQSVFQTFPRARAFAKLAVGQFWRPVGLELLGKAEWSELFVPVVGQGESAAKLLKVDEVATNILGSRIQPMRDFLLTV